MHLYKYLSLTEIKLVIFMHSKRSYFWRYTKDSLPNWCTASEEPSNRLRRSHSPWAKKREIFPFCARRHAYIGTPTFHTCSNFFFPLFFFIRKTGQGKQLKRDIFELAYKHFTKRIVFFKTNISLLNSLWCPFASYTGPQLPPASGNFTTATSG